MSITLLVTPKEVTAQSQLGGNIDSEKLRIPIRTSQDLKIRPILGGALYNKIESLFIAGSGVITLEPYKTLHEDYLKGALILYTASKFKLQTPTDTDNGGSTNYEPDNGRSSGRKDIVAQAQLIENDAEAYAHIMVEYLRANSSIFPEYSEIIDGDVKASGDVYFCGIELDGVDGDMECLDRNGNWIIRD